MTQLHSAPVLIEKVKEHEAYREWAYPDPAAPLAVATRGRRLRWGFEPAEGIIARLPEAQRALSGRPWTVGYGETLGVTPESRMSRADAHAQMVRRLAGFEAEVLAMCTRKPNPNQCAALVSLAYNIGAAALRRSSVLRLHNAGDFEGAARAFGLWVRAQGQVLPGLVRRRADEAALYLRPWSDAAMGAVQESPTAVKALAGVIKTAGQPEPVPDDEPQTLLVQMIEPDQEGQPDDWPPAPVAAPEIDEPEQVSTHRVDGERPLRQSKIVQGASVAGGTAALATAAEVTMQVGQVRAGLLGLGDWLVPLLLVAVVGLCGYVIWQRYQQRRKGVA